jgi:hypothetical protein
VTDRVAVPVTLATKVAEVPAATWAVVGSTVTATEVAEPGFDEPESATLAPQPLERTVARAMASEATKWLAFMTIPDRFEWLTH